MSIKQILGWVIFLGVILSSVMVVGEDSIGSRAKIVVAPLDSRPVSIEYMRDLVELGQDEWVEPNKDNLDFFSDSYQVLNHFGKSDKVRAEILDNVKHNNNEQTTVIINTSSYFTGGLIGSRCYKNYTYLEQGLVELKTLVSRYNKPYYYVNISMPRMLPEERNNSIWPNSSKVRGLGYFYSKYNRQCSDKIKNELSRVTPSQLLLEWSYVQGKEDEIGKKMLAPWEKEFLDYFNQTYYVNSKYSAYIKAYEGIFQKTAYLAKEIVKLQQQGLIDEVIISTDDMQLPTVIQYLIRESIEKKTEGYYSGKNVTKYGFVRAYLQVKKESIQSFHKQQMGIEEYNQALEGNSAHINYIYGIDQIPQLIYARDLVRRKKIRTNFEVVNKTSQIHLNASSYLVGYYDTDSIEHSIHSMGCFAGRTYNKRVEYTERLFKLFINRYIPYYKNRNEEEEDELIKELFRTYKVGDNIGLIEIYSHDVINTGENRLFQKICNEDYLEKLGIKEASVVNLDMYSSWNTGENTVGLGIAHAEVFGIVEQVGGNIRNIAAKQAQIILQHLLDDGIYCAQLKKDFYKRGYQMQVAENPNKKLYEDFMSSGVLQKFVNTPIRVGNQVSSFSEVSIEKCYFPWFRRFECYIEVNFQ